MPPKSTVPDSTSHRLMAALMMLVATSEKVMLECAGDPELAELQWKAADLRNLATEHIREMTQAPSCP